MRLSTVYSFLLFLCFSLSSLQSLAVEEKFFKAANFSGTVSGINFNFQDDKFGNAGWNTIEPGSQIVNNMVAFELNASSLKLLKNSVTYTLTLTVNVWYANVLPTAPPSATFYPTLVIQYDTTLINKSVYRDIFYFNGAHKVQVIANTLTTSSTPSPTPDFRLYSEILVKRKYKFNKLTGPLLDPFDTLPSYKNTVRLDSVEFKWLDYAGAEAYDLEYVFFDKKSVIGNVFTNNLYNYLSTYGSLFKNNATRVTVNGTSFKLRLLYPEGYIFYRVRAVRYKGNGEKEFTEWSLKPNLNSHVYYTPSRLTIGWHESQINWQGQITFAEDAKHVPTINFFDNTLRQRQSLTYNNADKMAIGDAIVYDAQGRPAVKVMPAPTFQSNLRFQPLFAASNPTTPFTKANFEKNDCIGSPDTMSVKHGAGRYYSPNNPLKNDNPHKYLPDAKNYPYAVTEFTPDLTGRIRRQTGVGNAFIFGTNRETRYFYGKPAQEELDRLFGNEAGNYSHYLKNLVIDPNGQASVSYLDAHGRTIATALSDTFPSNLITIGNDPSQQVAPINLTRSILNNVKNDFKLVSSYKILVNHTGINTFAYNLVPGSVQPACMTPGSKCYDCLYDLEIKITNECNYSFVRTKSNFTIGQYDTLCSVAPANLVESFGVSGLSPGVYTVVKTLTLSETALNYYADHFIKQSACLPNLQSLITQYQSRVDLSGCGLTCEECKAAVGTQAQYLTQHIQAMIDLGVIPSAADTLQAQSDYAAAVLICKELCESPSECEQQLEMLMADFVPGAQYATFSLVNGVVSVTDPTSIFYNNAYQTITYNHPNGTPIQVTVYDNTSGAFVSKSPSALTLQEFIQSFDSGWLPSMVSKHPEYNCYVAWCNAQNASSNSFDSLLNSVNTFAEALALGLMDSLGNILNDPFFGSGGAGAGYSSRIDSLMLGFNSNGCVNIPITTTIQVLENCGNLDSLPFNQGSAIDLNYRWIHLRNIYLGYKKVLQTQYRKSLPACNTPIVNCIEDTLSSACLNSPYRLKERRILRLEVDTEPTLQDLENEKNQALAYMQDEFIENCALQADSWMDALKGCRLNATDSVAIRQRLIEVCKGGADITHPFGATTTKNGVPTLYGDTSFEQAIQAVVGSRSECNDSCGAHLITFPGTYAQPIYSNATVATPIDCDSKACLCEKLDSLYSCFTQNAQGFTSFNKYLTLYTSFEYTVEQLDALRNACNDAQARQLPDGIPVAPYLECNTCKSCTEVKTKFDFFRTNICTDTTHINFYSRLARYLNKSFGFSMTGLEYRDFIWRCNANPSLGCNFGRRLCPDNMASPAPECATELLELARQEAILAYQGKIDSIRQEFIALYLAKCLPDTAILPGESFTLTSRYKEHHFTLYYYDQAGNLVKTVAPDGTKGKVLTSAADLNAVKAHRQNNTNPPKYPNYTHVTQYVYNSLNQVKLQVSPDATYTEFWYDAVGRLVASQDGRQRSSNKYSFTLYDALGRVTEVGEKTTTTALTDGTAKIQTSFFAWLTSGANNTRGKITRTFYDAVVLNANASFGPDGQTNLHNRVTASQYEEVYDNNNNTYQYATHYSYDPVGNVKSLVQEISALPQLHRYKRIDYDYDQISGKVNRVTYQPGKTDQFIHRYVYDDMNRLVEVFTTVTDSSDIGYNWEREAAYRYYLHGPMSRTELGRNRVQGLDYTYTLQGWMKVLNRSYLNEGKEPGTDGNNVAANPNRYVGRDVVGYSLNYYAIDYYAINAAGNDSPELPYTSSGFNTASQSLFNGNIRHMVYHNRKLADGKPVGYAYKYDQVNKLISKQRWTNAGTSAWAAGGSTDNKYNETFTYSPSGNILTHTKGVNVLNDMDNLNYQYYPNTNKLEKVSDVVADATFPNDVDNQAANNYTYDNSGNLTQDLKSGISAIQWSPYGKVERVTRNQAPLVHSIYGYDATQNRVLKGLIRNTNDTTFTYYIRDAQGNIMSTYTRHLDTITWEEAYLYGSSRLGSWEPGVQWRTGASVPSGPYYQSVTKLYEGTRRYEVTNHLGNVLATLSDRKRGINTTPNATTATHYEAVILSATDYYAFGQEMLGRTFTVDGYRFGYQGQETDDQVAGDGNIVHFKYREYDARIGRMWSVDPLKNKYPYYSPYSYSGNRVIDMVEIEGLEPQRPKQLLTSLGWFTPSIKVWDYYALVPSDRSESGFEVVTIGMSEGVLWSYEYLFYTGTKEYPHLDEKRWVVYNGTIFDATGLNDITPGHLMVMQTWEQYWAKNQMVQDALNNLSSKAEMAVSVTTLADGIINVYKGISAAKASTTIFREATESAAKGVIGMTDDAARFAAQSPRADHAMRHLIDRGIIEGAKNSKLARSGWNNLVSDVLTSPTKTFDYFLQGAQTKAFYKSINGKDVVLFVTKHNQGSVLQGQVIGAWVPTRAKNPDIMKLIEN